MPYAIRMGIPEMEELWNTLQKKNADGSISRADRELYKKWGSALKKLSMDPMYPGLKSHGIAELSQRYGIKVWQSYLENRTSGARRMYWVYGPGKGEITVIGLEPHPEDAKNGAYERIKLSDLN